MKQGRIIIFNGLLFKAELLDCQEADKVTRELTGFAYAEQLVQEQGNNTLLQIQRGKITRIIKAENNGK